VSTSADPVTIGVAIAVPEPHGSRLQAARRRFGDPLADLIQTHITLVGPRAVPRAALPEIAAHLAAVAARHPAYQVVLDGTGTFRPVTQVTFLQVGDGAQACTRLAADLQTGPLACAAAYPYHPHVTLAHDVAEGRLDAAQRELADERIEFAADALGLYVCGEDEHWHPHRLFPLTGAP
jgi:2'-5' RNA ligase